MQGAEHGPPAEQVHAAPPELPGARPREHEARRCRLLQDGVHDREQLRDPLDLVDDHGVPARRPRHQLPKALGAGAQAAMQGGVEQVQVQGVGQPPAQPGGFAGSARAEQEAAPVRDLEESTYKFHFASKNGKSVSRLHPILTRRSIRRTALVGLPASPRQTSSAGQALARGERFIPHPASFAGCSSGVFPSRPVPSCPVRGRGRRVISRGRGGPRGRCSRQGGGRRGGPSPRRAGRGGR